MRFVEDPRIKTGRRCFALAWFYYALYLIFLMGLSYILGAKPYVFGLPRWVAIGNFAIPLVFVLSLIFVVERFIPDIPLTDEEQEEGEE